jgi:RNA polymerase sigma-70 factor (ECF subfamily)
MAKVLDSYPKKGASAVGDDLPDGVDVALVVRRCIEGDDAAKAFFYGEYATHVERSIRRAFYKGGMACTEEDVEDVRNSLFLRLFTDEDTPLKRLKQPNSLRAWLAAIASNAAVDHMRSRIRADRLKQNVVQDPTFWKSETLQNPIEISERHNSLLNALNELHPEDRLILRLRYMQKLKYHEIASLLGLNINTASARLRRALDKLRRVLEGVTDEIF